MADWNEPTLATAYATFLSNLKARDLDVAKLDFSAATNLVDGMIQFVPASNKFQRRVSGAWVDIVLAVAGGGTGATSLGTMAAQNANNVNITGGAVSGLTSLYATKIGIPSATAPSGESGKGVLFFDTADSKLKVKENNGSAVKLIQVASEVAITPSGGIASSNVQSAIYEVAGPENHGGVLVNPYGITAAINLFTWIAPYVCTVTAVKGYRVGGTGATINARRNGSSNHLSSALSLTSADTVMDGGAVQNTAYQVGDKLEVMAVSVSGSPTQLGIIVYFTRA